MTLNEQQTKRANKLLKALCGTDFINGENVYPFFDSEKEAVYVCSVLADRQLLTANWNENDIIAELISNENTCNAVENKLLDKELNSEKRTILSSKLNIIVAIFSIVFGIVGFGAGSLVHYSPKSGDSSELKANLDAYETRESEYLTRVSNLNHVVDSLKNENKILLEKAQNK